MNLIVTFSPVEISVVHFSWHELLSLAFYDDCRTQRGLRGSYEWQSM